MSDAEGASVGSTVIQCQKIADSEFSGLKITFIWLKYPHRLNQPCYWIEPSNEFQGNAFRTSRVKSH